MGDRLADNYQTGFADGFDAAASVYAGITRADVNKRLLAMLNKIHARLDDNRGDSRRLGQNMFLSTLYDEIGRLVAETKGEH